MVYWLIGQPGSGKTTLAKKLYARLLEYEHCLHLDGDDLRLIFNNAYEPKHFSRNYREEQTRVLQKFVAYLDNQSSVDIVVSTVNPYRDIREEFKLTHHEVVEIYVWKERNELRKEYAVSEFEEPLKNCISINTTGKTVDESFDELWKMV